MTEDKTATINKRLGHGIDAARAGRTEEARRHLISVLRQDANHIPALLWLAFVMPSSHDATRLLEQVLVLDPDNERAKAGIRWARGRLDSLPHGSGSGQMALTERAQSSSDHKAADVADLANADLLGNGLARQQLLASNAQKQAKQGALARRARRTLKPLLSIIFIVGTLGLVSIGLGALNFVSPETLSMWLPPLIENVLANSEVLTASPQVPVAQSAETAAIVPAARFFSQADTLSLQAPPRSDVSLVPSEAAGPTTALELRSELAELLPVPETTLTSPEPSMLLGPERPAAGLEAAKPVENLLLVHQPAHPGEKWIEVNVSTQQITAWEGDVPVFSFAGSTGLPNTPTVVGEFHIYWKLESTVMIGPNYYLPEVPYTMYFYRGFALHGTYWHNNFGQPMSHGCVNLETSDAKKLFEWADPVIPPGQTEVVASMSNPGTLVVVHQ
jgi:hypothetical protein